MTTHTYDANKLLQALSALAPEGQQAFATSCAERLYPSYVRYSRTQTDGSPGELRQALDGIRSALLGGSRPSVSQEHVDRLILLAPSDEPGDPSWTIDMHLAYCAVYAAAYAVRTGFSRSAQDAVWAAQMAVEAAFECLKHTHTQMTMLSARQQVEWAENTPLMQEELARQDRDLRTLQAVSRSDLHQAIGILLERASSEGGAMCGDG